MVLANWFTVVEASKRMGTLSANVAALLSSSNTTEATPLLMVKVWPSVRPKSFPPEVGNWMPKSRRTPGCPVCVRLLADVFSLCLSSPPTWM